MVASAALLGIALRVSSAESQGALSRFLFGSILEFAQPVDDDGVIWGNFWDGICKLLQ